MMWFYLSLLPPAIWACVNTIDKIVVGKYIDRPIVYLIFTGLATLIPVSLLPLWCNFDKISVSLILLSIATGSIYIFYTWFFFRSLQISDAPVVANLLLLVPVISLFMGTILFHERFHIHTYGGILLVIGGVLGTSFEKREGKNRTKNWSLTLTPAFVLMFISAILTSIDYTLEKYILMQTNEITLFYWNRVGILIATGCILLIPKSPRKDFIRTLRFIPHIIPISLINEILDMTAAFILISAYYSGPLSLVTAIISIQPLFVLIFINIVNKIRPNTVPTSGDKKYFLIRFACIIIAVVGIYLISLTG